MPDIIVPTGATPVASPSPAPLSANPSIDELIALVKSQGAPLATLKKQADGGIGKIEFRHCNVDGTRVDDQTGVCPRCGSTEINSVGLGSRFMPDGQPDLVLLRQGS